MFFGGFRELSLTFILVVISVQAHAIDIRLQPMFLKTVPVLNAI